MNSVETPVIDPRSLVFVVSAIETTARIGTAQALKAVSKSSPNSAKEAATSLKASIDEDFLPYLNGGTVHVSTEIKRLLNSSLLAGIPSMIRDGISAAAGILDAFLPIPAAGTLLSPDQVDYIRAFVKGVEEGCGDFIPDPATGEIRMPRASAPRWVDIA